MEIHEFGPSTSQVEVVVPTANVKGRWFPGCRAALEASTIGQVRLIAVESSGPEFNFARSVNEGIARTTRDVFILNDDARVAPDALAALLRARGDWGEGVYNPFLHTLDGAPAEIGWSYDGTLWAPIRYAISVRAPFDVVRRLASGTFYPIFPHRLPHEGFHGFGFGAALLTKGAFDQVGPLDERFPLGCEDFDYSLRCHTLGIPYYAVPDSIVYHATKGTRKYTDSRVMTSKENFAEKWPRDRIREALASGVAGKVARRPGLSGRP